MKQTDHSLLEKMNIKSDAIIGNQCEYNSIESFEWNNHLIKYLNFAERGVGLNRNNALMRANGDVCLFADDDIVFCDDYVEVITNSFNDCPDADVIVFNLYENDTTRYVIKKKSKVGYFNYLRYGTARIAIKLNSIKTAGISFNLCFGGGTDHCHGEDNLFLTDCLKHGLKIYAMPRYIASLTGERESTWNKGFNKKYLEDQGFLYKNISRKYWRALVLQDAIRHHRDYKMSFMEAYRVMLSGGRK